MRTRNAAWGVVLAFMVGCDPAPSIETTIGARRAPQVVLDKDLIAMDGDQQRRGSVGAGTLQALKNPPPAALQQAAANAAVAAQAGVGTVAYLYADGWRAFTLRAIGGNAEIWVANDLSYCYGSDPRPAHVITQPQIDYLFNELNNTIYPSNTTYFGKTLDRDGQGGIFGTAGHTDNPQRVMALVYNIIDEGYCDPSYPFYVAGYVWPAMNKDYANRNIIHIDSADWANRIGAGVNYPHLYEQVFTHEYEHAIHSDHDADESSWIDEGMADLAPYLAGYGHSQSHLAYYLVYHRSPLTVWGGNLEDYGKSYLFQLYLLENFGGAPMIKALVDEQANGSAGINNQLKAFGYKTTFDEIYRDWTVANYLDDPSQKGLSGAKLGYLGLDIPSADTWGYSIQWSVDHGVYGPSPVPPPLPRPGNGHKTGQKIVPGDALLPYAPTYFNYRGFTPTLMSKFEGVNEAGLTAHEGSYQLWSGRGDLLYVAATTATAITVGAGGALSFWANYDTEAGWDFGFVQVSTDGGASWTSLANGDTTSDCAAQAHPDVLANLPGLTGSSGGWKLESFDLSAYAGTSILIRFLYVTDWAMNGAGFYVDQVAVSDASGTRFADTFEASAASWALSGWQHTTGLVPCDWTVTFLNPKGTKVEVVEAKVAHTGKSQKDNTTLNTDKNATRPVTVILSTRMSEANSFFASFGLLVQ